MKIGVIIVAAGNGTRMDSDVPKQFMLLCGTPILMRTVMQFYNTLPEAKIVIVIGSEQRESWNNLCPQYGFNIEHQIVEGGTTRFESVKNGLKAVEDCQMVAIHDGVRPLVTQAVILETLALAQQHGAATACITPIDSLRKVVDMKNYHVDRQDYRIVQTPQIFRNEILQQAYKQEYKETFTDDASVVEAMGYTIELSNGDRNNIKITNRLDLYLAEIICKNH